MLTVTITKADSPPDAVFGVYGLGEFTNGVPREITPDEEAAYFAATRTRVDSLKGAFTVTGTSEFYPSNPVVPLEPQDAPTELDEVVIEPTPSEGSEDNQ